MTGGPGTGREIQLLGLSHHTAPVEVRERVAFDRVDYGVTLRRLVDQAGLTEALLLSTCNRSEFVAVGDSQSNGRQASLVRDLLRERAGEAVDPFLYQFEGARAVVHLFRVAASLDSMVVGEAQILGQVNDAYEAAHDAGTLGPILDRLFTRARAAAKRVRSETAIGQLHVSVASVAVELARKIFASLEGRSLLVLGAGETSRLTLQHMTSAGVTKAFVANRSLERAQEMAGSLGARAVPFEQRAEMLRDVDIVISATSADTLLLTREEMSQAMGRRRGRPIFLIDLAVPRDIDPECRMIDGVFLYNVDDLQQVVDRNASERQREAELGRVIVEEEAARFLSWLEAQHIVPTVVALRRQVDQIREAEEAKFLARLQHLSLKDQATVRSYGQALMNKILHAPTVGLKESGDPRKTARMVEVVRELFQLDQAIEEALDESSEPGDASR